MSELNSGLGRRVFTKIDVGYPQSPLLLDGRGDLARRALAAKLGTRWEADDDSVDITDATHSLHFAVEHAACAWSLDENADNHLAFFLSEVIRLSTPESLSITSYHILGCESSFNDMVAAGLSAWTNSAFSFVRTAEIRDIGWLFDFKVSGGTTLLRVGPMNRTQLAAYISKRPLVIKDAVRAAMSGDSLPSQAWFAGLDDQLPCDLAGRRFEDTVRERLNEFSGIVGKIFEGLSTLTMDTK